MPRCDICHKVVKDIHGSVMTYKHGQNGRIGFTCGDCIEEKDYDKELGEKGGKRLPNLLEEESKEKEYETDKI